MLRSLKNGSPAGPEGKLGQNLRREALVRVAVVVVAGGMGGHLFHGDHAAF